MYLEGLVNLLSAHTATALPFDVVQSDMYACAGFIMWYFAH
jgi:hypothetical protein